ncbi:MAG: amidohydrolase family protein [bacterium]|nr:amidohydrolase family protein [bacterium]
MMPYEIIDSHVHYWEADRPDRPWSKDGADIGAPLSAEELLRDAAEAGVSKVLQVTPSIMGFDNRYSIEAAQRHPDRIVGVIGRFDPSGNHIRRRLAEYIEQPAVLGARVTLIKRWERWLTDGVLETFLAEAGRLGMPVQIYAPDQAAAVRSAAMRHGETTFLVDHMTLRHSDPEPFRLWNDVLALSGAPNVYLKVSYFPEVAHGGYPFQSVQPYFESLYERFGPDRLIWGSNYPPSRSACAYKESVDFVSGALSFLSVADKEKILGKTLLRALGVS